MWWWPHLITLRIFRSPKWLETFGISCHWSCLHLHLPLRVGVMLDSTCSETYRYASGGLLASAPRFQDHASTLVPAMFRIGKLNSPRGQLWCSALDRKYETSTILSCYNDNNCVFCGLADCETLSLRFSPPCLDVLMAVELPAWGYEE